jgi:methylase of polypeptide subunit release factors
MYRLVDFRLSIEAPLAASGFPVYQQLQQAVTRLDPPARTLFQLLRLGEAVDRASIETSIPSAVLEAFVRTGLLVRAAGKAFSTPSLLLVPVEGVFVFVGIPPSYPTASKPPGVWFDLTSYAVAAALPGSLEGQRALDICAGSGIQSLLCAARGAASVLGLEINEEAVELASINAALNGMSGRTEFRYSDKLTALADHERFDFVVCNPPYAPAIDRDTANPTLDAIGNSVLLRSLDSLPSHLSERGAGILAAWLSIGRSGSTWQTDVISSRLAQAGCSCTVFSIRSPDAIEHVLHIVEKEAGDRYGVLRAETIVKSIRKQLADSEAPEGCYHQVILFRHDSSGRTRLFRMS